MTSTFHSNRPKDSKLPSKYFDKSCKPKDARHILNLFESFSIFRDKWVVEVHFALILTYSHVEPSMFLQFHKITDYFDVQLLITMPSCIINELWYLTSKDKNNWNVFYFERKSNKNITDIDISRYWIRRRFLLTVMTCFICDRRHCTDYKIYN
jgi:hypothetical protein